MYFIMRHLNRIFLISFLTVFVITAGVPDLYAQYFNFGKNRVQYDDFDWRYIETDHFDIYYYDEKNYHLAQFTAETVESSLMQLTEDIGEQLTDRIPVIIYGSHSDFSQTNVVRLPVDAQGIGGVTDKYKNRMTQPFMGDYADFRRTIQHELLHAYINDVYYGGSVQSIVQNNIQLVFPLWFEEGLAEFLAQGWDTQTDMYMRDAVLNNYLPPLPQLSGFLSYRGGQSFWYFIADQYGRPKIAEIMQRIQTTRNIQLHWSSRWVWRLMSFQSDGRSTGNSGTLRKFLTVKPFLPSPQTSAEITDGVLTRPAQPSLPGGTGSQ